LPLVATFCWPFSGPSIGSKSFRGISFNSRGSRKALKVVAINNFVTHQDRVHYRGRTQPNGLPVAVGFGIWPIFLPFSISLWNGIQFFAPFSIFICTILWF
jgi:hypothetical protein